MAGEVKVSLMTYLDTVPDDAKIYVVKPGDTTPYYTTKADLLAGIVGGTTPPINTVLTAGHIVTSNDQIFQLSATKFLKINRAAQRIEFWDTTISALETISYWEASVFNIGNASTEYTFTVDIGAGSFGITDNIGGNNIIIGVNALMYNGETYPYPTGASSPLATQLYVDNKVAGLLDLRGSHDCSGNAFPTTGGSGTGGAILKGDFWYVSVAGVLNGVAVNIGDSFFALNDSPTSGQWQILESNLGYVPEDAANKTDTMTGNTASSTKYLSAKGVYDYLIGMTWLTNAIFGTFLQGQTAKDTLVDADGVVSFDSADSNKSKKTTWLNVWVNFLKPKADAVYQAYFYRDSATSSAVTATTSNTLIASALIPANTFAVGSSFDVLSMMQRVGTTGSATWRIYTNTSNSLSGAVLLATYTNGAANLWFFPKRTFLVRASNLLFGFTNNVTLLNDELISNNAPTTATFNPTVDNYIIIAIQPSSGSDSFTSELLEIKGKK